MMEEDTRKKSGEVAREGHPIMHSRAVGVCAVALPLRACYDPTASPRVWGGSSSRAPSHCRSATPGPAAGTRTNARACEYAMPAPLGLWLRARADPHRDRARVITDRFTCRDTTRADSRALGSPRSCVPRSWSGSDTAAGRPLQASVRGLSIRFGPRLVHLCYEQ